MLAHSESLTSTQQMPLTSPRRTLSGSSFGSVNKRWSSPNQFVFASQQSEEIIEPAPRSTPRSAPRATPRVLALTSLSNK